MTDLIYSIHDYGCDALGHLYTGNYIRMAEDAALHFWQSRSPSVSESAQAVLAAGPDRMLLELNQPLVTGDQVRVKNTALDVSNGAVRVLHAFHTSEDALAASCQTMWALPDGGRAALADLQASLEPINNTTNSAAWPQAPAPPAPPDGVIERPARVGWRDVSPRQHAFAGAYMDYMVDSAIFAGEHFGWDFEDSLQAGFAFVARRQWLDVLSPARLGEALRVETWLYGLRRTTAYRHYIIRRAGSEEIVARGTTYWAAVDISTGRPTRIPERFKHDLAAHIA